MACLQHAGAAGPAASGPAARTVTLAIDGMRFVPETTTVHRGDRVVWQNKDLVPHTVTSAGAFDSHAIPAGGSWSYTASRVGDYRYICVFHPDMKGRLQVQ